MRYLRLVVILLVLGGMAACTYTKTDRSGRVEKISREEYKELQR